MWITVGVQVVRWEDQVDGLRVRCHHRLHSHRVRDDRLLRRGCQKQVFYQSSSYRYGEDNLKVYHSMFKPLEWAFLDHGAEQCYAKIIVNTTDDRVVGLHYLGPNAGEVT